MALAVLSIDLVAKMAKFEADMGKAARASQKTADQISSAFSVIKGAAGGLAGAFSIGALVTFTKATIDSIDALNDVADATGSSIENISALEDIAARTGTTMDTVSGALVKFNGVLKDAKPGSDAERSLTALGLSFKELQTLDPAEALRRTAVALSAFADDGNKARLVQDLFGKSVKESAPFLKDLAEQSKLVATVTKEQAAEAEKFNKELFAMQKTIQDVSRALAGPLVASINESIEKFRQGAKEGKSFYEVIRQEQLKFLGMNTTTQDYADQLNTVNARLASSNPSISTRNKLLAQQAELMAKLAKPVFPAGNAGRGGVNPDSVKPSVGVVPDKPTKPPGGGGVGAARQSEAERYLESLQKQLERTQELSAVEQVMLDISKGRLGKVNASQQGALLNIAKQIDAVKSQEEAEKLLAKAIKETSEAQEDFFDAVMKADDAKQKQIASLLGATQSAEIERQREDMRLLTSELEEGRISEDLYLEAVSQRLGLTADKLGKTKTLADDLNLSFTSAFEDAIVGGKGLSEVLKGLEADLIRIITRKLVTKPLEGAIDGAIGGLNPGNFISSLFSADGGGYTGSGPRSGGVDGKGGFMAVLHPQETVVDHTKGQSMGKTNNVTVNVSQSFAPGTSRATTLQAASDARRQLEYAGRNL